MYSSAVDFASTNGDQDALYEVMTLMVKRGPLSLKEDEEDILE